MPKAIDQVLGAPASERGARTREALLTAAVSLIAENGFRAVTTRRVAARAGVPPSLVHYHFGSVATLARQAAMRAMSSAFEPAMRELLEAPDLVEGLTGAMDATEAFTPEQPETRVLLETMVQAVRDPALASEIRALLAVFRTTLAGRIATGQASGGIDASVPAAGAATLVAALLDGVALHHLLDPDTDVDGAGRALSAMLEPQR